MACFPLSQYKTSLKGFSTQKLASNAETVQATDRRRGETECLGHTEHTVGQLGGG